MEQKDRDMLLRIDERTANHTKQLDNINKMMNNGGCARGKTNATSIKWLYTLFLLACSAFGWALKHK